MSLSTDYDVNRILRQFKTDDSIISNDDLETIVTYDNIVSKLHK